ncbi:hypothetical protein [Priestia megaterium]|uniref:hypothetical protein n=1 Tax=Priestia megaterium TaxID=1404 RepID=UPI001642D054|nr:hypothetical protein [Priestia megaterium]
MLFENEKVVVYNNGKKETGVALSIIRNTVFIKLDMDGVVLPFELNKVKRASN